MDLAWLVRSVAELATQLAQTLLEHLIHRPLQGVVAVIEGLSLIVPDLTQATTAAVVQAITGQLTVAGQVRVRLGLDLLQRGVRLLAWPAVLLVALMLDPLGGSLGLLIVAALLLAGIANLEVFTADSPGVVLPSGWRLVTPSPA